MKKRPERSTTIDEAIAESRTSEDRVISGVQMGDFWDKYQPPKGHKKMQF